MSIFEDLANMVSCTSRSPQRDSSRRREVGRYTTLFPFESWQKVDSYLQYMQQARGEELKVGERLRQSDMFNIGVEGWSRLDLIRALMEQRRFEPPPPSSDGDASSGDWSPEELAILGDVSFAMDVTVYDDGSPYTARRHNKPFKATLIYTCGASTADLPELEPNGTNGDESSFFRLYQRRLVPCFQYIDDESKKVDRHAFVTVPALGGGVGCQNFGDVLARILEAYGSDWVHIRGVLYDPCGQEEPSRRTINGIQYIIQSEGPPRSSSVGRPQLCRPLSYEGAAGGIYDKFSECHLFSFVDCDHGSWPGSSYAHGTRDTDRNAKTAATDAMLQITHEVGEYDKESAMYKPPRPYETWAHAMQYESGKVLTTTLLNRG